MGFGGFLGALGKIGAGVAAPLTGGASLAAIPAIDAIGGIAGKAAGGMAAGRQGENELLQRQNELKARMHDSRQKALLDALGAESREQLDHAEFGLKAPMARGKQGLLASLIQGYKPASMSGLSPRLQKSTFSVDGPNLGPQAGIVAKLMGDNAIRGLSGGDTLQRTDFRSNVLDAPKLEAMKKSGLLEKILGGAGLGGSLIGGVGGAIQKARGNPASFYNEQGGG